MAVTIVIRPPSFIARLLDQLKKPYYKIMYQRIAKRTKDIEMEFMNYGYAPLGGEVVDLYLCDRDEFYRYPIQLYYHLVSQIDTKGKKGLEVGSGRGGGSDFISRYFKPIAMVGLDLSPTAIGISNEKYCRPGLHYQAGDAQRLPFENESFDFVVNVESSHCYPTIEKFFNEVYRVLKPGGYFLYTDYRTQYMLEKWLSQVEGLPFEIINKQNITENVVSSLELDSDRKEAQAERAANNEKEEKDFKAFAALAGGNTHESFKAHKWEYYSFIMRKAL